MASYRVISSDSHIVEPADLWTSRIEPKYRDRCPHLVRQDDGDWWYCDGVKIGGVEPGTQTGLRFEEPHLVRKNLPNVNQYVEQVRPGGYIPEEHVKDMEADGVYAGVLYPSNGSQMYRYVEDGELLSAMFRAYNDWLAEFCKPFPDRLKGNAMLNVDVVQEGVNELERCAKMGLAGAMIPVYPPEGRTYDSPEYESLWSAAEDLGIPIALHSQTNRPGLSAEKARKPSFTVNRDHWARLSITDMISSGVFERHPKLRVGIVEDELSWAVFLLDRMDYCYTQRTRSDDWPPFNEDMLPSDYFHRNVFISFQEEAMGIRLRDVIGVDNLLWGSDYPHRESTFPRSRQILEEILAECTEDEKAKIAGGNAAKIYHFD